MKMRNGFILKALIVLLLVTSDVHAWPWDRATPASNVTPAPPAAPATPLLPLSAYFATDTITPPNQVLFDQGLSACRDEDWALAIRYFTEARKSAPYYAPLIFNLGLAHSKAGNDLAAIAWFRTYLAIRPTDENRASIEGEIERLKGVVRGKISQIAGAAKITNPFEDTGVNHIKFLVQAGDLDVAEEFVRTLPPSDAGKLWLLLGKALMQKGDVRGAWRAVRMAKDAGASFDYQGFFLQTIMLRAMSDGDMIFAQNVLTLQGNRSLLAQKQALMGDLNAAEATGAIDDIGVAQALLIRRDPANARRIAEKILRTDTMDAQAWAIMGDDRKALQIVEAHKNALLMPALKAFYFGALAHTQILCGNTRQAEETARRAAQMSGDVPYGDNPAAEAQWERFYSVNCPKHDGERLPRWYIAIAYLRLGNVDKALEEAKKILPSSDQGVSYRYTALIFCAKKLIEMGDFARASDVIKLAEDDLRGSYAFISSNQYFCSILQDVSNNYIRTRNRVYIDWIKNETNRERALGLSRSSIDQAWTTWIHPDYMEYETLEGAELLLRQQAAMGVSEGLIAQPVVDWTIFATFADRYMDLQKNLEHARNPRENASADVISSEMKKLAKRMYCVYLAIEQMESGQLDAYVASLFKSDLFSDY